MSRNIDPSEYLSKNERKRQEAAQFNERYERRQFSEFAEQRLARMRAHKEMEEKAQLEDERKAQQQEAVAPNE